MHLFSTIKQKQSLKGEERSKLRFFSYCLISLFLLYIATSVNKKRLVASGVSCIGCYANELKSSQNCFKYLSISTSNLENSCWNLLRPTRSNIQFFFSTGKKGKKTCGILWNRFLPHMPLLLKLIDVQGPFPPLKLACLCLRRDTISAKTNAFWSFHDNKEQISVKLRKYLSWTWVNSTHYFKAQLTPLLDAHRYLLINSYRNDVIATSTHEISFSKAASSKTIKQAESFRSISRVLNSGSSTKPCSYSKNCAPVMAWRCTGRSNAELINNLRSAEIIRNSRVYKTMLEVDRANYVQYNPYADSPQSLGHGVTISAPHMHGHALELLHEQLKPGNRALDIGSGSGYLTVCMARMVDVLRNDGVAVGLELLPSLIDMSKRNVEQDAPELLKNSNFQLIVGDGWKGGPSEHAPYHAIHVGAAASEVPLKLVEQLAKGGKMIIPVEKRFGQELMEITKDESGNIHEKNLFGVAYVELKKTKD